MGEMFIWSKLGQNPSHIHICKDKESNLGPVAGYSDWNYPELSYIFVCVQNSRWFCNLKEIFNALNKVLCLASAMEYADGDNKIVFIGMPLRRVINKIVFTSPEAMVEFSGEKWNLGARQNPLNISKYIFVWKVNYIRPFLLTSLRLQITQPRYAKNVK